VFLAERLSDLDCAPSGSVVILGSVACLAATGYQFDVALRVAVDRGVVAVLLSDPDGPPVPATAVHMARRAGITIVRLAEPAPLAEVIMALHAAIQGSADLALRRAIEAFHVMSRRGADPQATIPAVARAAQAEVAVASEPGASLSFPIMLEGEPDQWIVMPGHSVASRPELVLVGALLAGTLAVAAGAARRAEDLPIRSRAELLAEILDSPATRWSELLRRARGMGIAIDGWHVVVRVEHDNADELWDDEVTAFEAREDLARISLEAVSTLGGTWHTARSAGALLLIRMYRNDPGPSAVADVTAAANRALAEIARRLPRAIIHCGVGAAHPGPTGLANSAAEAQAAVAGARTRKRPRTAVAFDNLGLRRTLVEWYASHAAREAITNVLAPLDRLGGAKATAAIKTLQVYLDNRGSLARTAAELHLHRNAVAYRVNRIFAELEVDPDNADDWLLLQLACRARGLA
jgi:sugar diacid utilization regulator